MKSLSKINVLLIVMLVAGFSIAAIGCNSESPTEPAPTPTPEPQPTTKTLLDVDVVVNANTNCAGSISFCEDDGLTFEVPEARKTVNIRVTGAANMTLAVYVLDPDDDMVVVSASGVTSFEPKESGNYSLWVYDANEVGGTVHVVVTQ